MKILETTVLPTQYGNFEMIAIESEFVDFPHIVLKTNDYLKKDSPTLTRIHSECMTGDVFGSARCDCGQQLEKSLDLIGKEGGVLIYLRQEGRGIGLVNKMKAYQLQDKGLDTVDANLALGFHQDSRKYDLALEILQYLGIKKLELITNNPDKLDLFNTTDILVAKRRNLNITANSHNQSYFSAKKDKFGHLL
jgi:3,4-dihydroxy 2-butanone 4-phosphate synthase / GTP cyclohydrolase II